MIKMANNENLLKGKDTQFKTGEEQARIAQKGGLQLGINNKLNKTMEAIGQAIAKCEPAADFIEELKSKYPNIAGDIIDNKVLLVAKLFEEALKGNLNAIAMFRDTIGEKPIDKLDINNEKEFDLRDTEVYVESEVKAMSYEAIKSLIENKHLKKYVVVSDKDMEETAAEMKKEFEDG